MCRTCTHKKSLDAGLTNQRSPRRNPRPFSGSPRQRETGAFGPHVGEKKVFNVTQLRCGNARWRCFFDQHYVILLSFTHAYWLIFLVLETIHQLSIISIYIFYYSFLLFFLWPFIFCHILTRDPLTEQKMIKHTAEYGLHILPIFRSLFFFQVSSLAPLSIQ